MTKREKPQTKPGTLWRVKFSTACRNEKKGNLGIFYFRKDDILMFIKTVDLDHGFVEIWFLDLNGEIWTHTNEDKKTFFYRFEKIEL